MKYCVRIWVNMSNLTISILSVELNLMDKCKLSLLESKLKHSMRKETWIPCIHFFFLPFLTAKCISFDKIREIQLVLDLSNGKKFKGYSIQQKAKTSP